MLNTVAEWREYFHENQYYVDPETGLRATYLELITYLCRVSKPNILRTLLQLANPEQLGKIVANTTLTISRYQLPPIVIATINLDTETMALLLMYGAKTNLFEYSDEIGQSYERHYRKYLSLPYAVFKDAFDNNCDVETVINTFSLLIDFNTKIFEFDIDLENNNFGVKAKEFIKTKLKAMVNKPMSLQQLSRITIRNYFIQNFECYYPKVLVLNKYLPREIMQYLLYYKYSLLEC